MSCPSNFSARIPSRAQILLFSRKYGPDPPLPRLLPLCECIATTNCCALKGTSFLGLPLDIVFNCVGVATQHSISSVLEKDPQTSLSFVCIEIFQPGVPVLFSLPFFSPPFCRSFFQPRDGAPRNLDQGSPLSFCLPDSPLRAGDPDRRAYVNVFLCAFLSPPSCPMLCLENTHFPFLSGLKQMDDFNSKPLAFSPAPKCFIWRAGKAAP